MTGLPWDASYHDGPAPWDTGQPQPAIVRLASEGGLAGPVLDAGCGTGENALHVAALGLPVLGVDVAETALAITRHIAFGSDAATMGAMADARNNRSLSPDIQPTQDVARLELRASDADRDRTAAVLGNALATGRLTSTEHAERLDAAYTATTLGQLATLTRDLPADDAAGTSMAAVDRAEVAARFSKVIRSGRWVAGRRTRLTSHFGALVVNLADAVLPGREITLEVDAFCGKLILTVPAGAHVIDEGGALFAKRAIYGRQDPGDADGPVIRLVGEARFSKVAVHRGHYDPHGPWRHW